MNNVFFQFGHASWWKYFIKVADSLANSNKEISIYGMTTGVEAFWGLKATNYKTDALEEVYIRIRNGEIDSNLLEGKIYEIEKRYGNIWRFAYADRQLVTYHHNERYAERNLTTDEILAVVVGFFDYFEEVFNRHSIDTVFTYATASAPFYIAAAVIKRRGGNYYQTGSLRYPDFVTLFLGPYMTTFALNESPGESDYAWAKDYYEKLHEGLTKPAWTGILKLVKETKKNSSILSMKKVENSYKHAFVGFDVNDPGHFIPPVKTRIKRKLNFYLAKLSLRLNRGLFFNLPERQRIAFFPLHVEPEASTMVMGQNFLSQIALIELIARSLPYGIRLCVKEHPWMVGKRPFFYYKELAQIPNVILLKNFIDSVEIIKKSSIIITNTGTAGLEGFIMGKPVVVFGKTHFNHLNGVSHFDRPVSELYVFIKNCIDEYVYSRDSVLSYLAHARRNSINVSSSFTFRQDIDENVVASLLIELISKIATPVSRCKKLI